MGKVLDKLQLQVPQLFPDLEVAKKWELTLEKLIEDCYTGDDSKIAVLETALHEVAVRSFRVGKDEAIFNGLLYLKCCSKMCRTPQVWIHGLVPVHVCEPKLSVEVLDEYVPETILPDSLSVTDARKLAPEYLKRAAQTEMEIKNAKLNRNNLILAIGDKI